LAYKPGDTLRGSLSRANTNQQSLAILHTSQIGTRNVGFLEPTLKASSFMLSEKGSACWTDSSPAFASARRDAKVKAAVVLSC
jgi:hypothetical protein